MSRIFEALQRSESERSGTLPQIATELLEAVERDAPEAAPVSPAVPPVSVSATVPAELRQFRSLPVVVSLESRLVSLTEQESLAAEKFRFLGVRLRQLQQTRPLKKVL